MKTQKLKDKAKSANAATANETTESATITEKTMVKLADFVENPDNPSTATEEEIARLAGKLKRVPLGLTAMRIAYVTDRTGAGLAGKRVVISGNKRLRCLKAAFGDDAYVPAEWFADVTAMSEAERHEFIVSANVSDGSWDVNKLLAQYDRAELGELMGAEAVEELLADVEEVAEEGQTDEDAVPEVPQDPKSRRGAVYQLGRHRVMCGDSTSEEDVEKLMGGCMADMVFTDPPYNVSIGDRNAAINAAGKKHGQKNLGGIIEKNILGDIGMTDEECGEKLWKPAFTNMQKFASDHCVIYVTMPQGGTHMMMMMMMRGSWQVKHELMWLKDQPTFSMGRLDYDYKHEPICYGWNKTHRFFGKGDFTKSVWEIPKPRSSKDHPTMKPVELVENALLNSSQENEIVMDLFGGSGTTALACEKHNRCARLMELDAHYVDVIRRRWAEFVHGEGCEWESLTPEIKEEN